MKINKSLLLMLMGVMVSLSASGQTWARQLQEMDSSQLALLFVIAVILGIVVLLLVLMVYLLSLLKIIFKQQSPELAYEYSYWERFKEKFVTGKMKPIEEEEEILMDHSYDGIVELDNFMPPWLQYLFIGTMVFGTFYWINYSVLGWGKTPTEEYQEELRIAAIEAEERQSLALATIDEYNVMFDKSGPAIKAGQTIFENNCAACHAMDGGGGVGPNLTDEYWIHGGSVSDIFRIVKYGVIEKGMVPWEDVLSPEEMQQVSSYILTLQGTQPLNPKAPQGEKYEPVIEQPLDALSEDDLSLEPAENEQ